MEFLYVKFCPIIDILTLTSCQIAWRMNTLVIWTNTVSPEKCLFRIKLTKRPSKWITKTKLACLADRGLTGSTDAPIICLQCTERKSLMFGRITLGTRFAREFSPFAEILEVQTNTRLVLRTSHSMISKGFKTRPFNLWTSNGCTCLYLVTSIPFITSLFNSSGCLSSLTIQISIYLMYLQMFAITLSVEYSLDFR